VPWSAFAPGKLILAGEHAVVYGHRAVAAAVSLGTTVTLRDRPGPSGIDESPLQDARLWPALSTLVPPDGVGVSIASTLPVGCGMGSSAALAVALVRALDAREGRMASFDTCFERGFAVERAFHGTPSGIDHAVSALGGVVAYRRAPQGPELDPLRLPSRLRLVVIDTGSPGDTAAMVAAVRARGQHDVIEAIGALAEAFTMALRAGNDIGPLLDENHVLLQRLGVSTPALDAAVDLLRAAGARGAKLAGAGGGGVAFGRVDADVEAHALTRARALGFRAFTVSVG
jgi:mevalonate kinase